MNKLQEEKLDHLLELLDGNVTLPDLPINGFTYIMNIPTKYNSNMLQLEISTLESPIHGSTFKIRLLENAGSIVHRNIIFHADLKL